MIEMNKDTAEIKPEVRKMGPWFHNIHLPDGTQTAPEHPLGDFPSFKWEQIKDHIPEDLEGWQVLDIGCNAGFYSIELARRGANVLAIDLDEHYLEQARYVSKEFGLSDKITFCQLQVYDLARLDHTFDMIWFMGVFYHLRYPLLALDIISRKVKKYLVFQTLLKGDQEEIKIPENVEIDERHLLEKKSWPSMAFIENKLAGDPSNWWVANHQCAQAMLRDCGFNIVAHPEAEIYIARPQQQRTDKRDGWNASEYLSATGREWRLDVDRKTNKSG